jgi:hypothetical protein
MLKVNEEILQEMENHYSGILDSIRSIEEAELPSCSRCRSDHTADVQIGITARTTYIAAATTKIKLLPNPPKPARYFCNKCERFFN